MTTMMTLATGIVIFSWIFIFATLAAYSKGRIDGRDEALEEKRIARFYGLER